MGRGRKSGGYWPKNYRVVLGSPWVRVIVRTGLQDGREACKSFGAFMRQLLQTCVRGIIFLSGRDKDNPGTDPTQGRLPLGKAQIKAELVAPNDLEG
mgnify:CR=1 FL=1